MHEKILAELVEKLKRAAGANLQSVVLYGSAAGGEFHPAHSDLNALCLLRSTDATELGKLHDVARWWAKKGHPAPLVFTLAELQSAVDVYTIELLEIKNHRRILYGEDPFEPFQPPTIEHRCQVERELRHNLVRLRQNYILAAGNRKAVLAVMTGSVSAFGMLFRHALIALGEQPPDSNQEAAERLGALLNFSPTPFQELFKVRSGTRKGASLDLSLFKDYLEAIERAVSEIDRRFDELRR